MGATTSTTPETVSADRNDRAAGAVRVREDDQEGVVARPLIISTFICGAAAALGHLTIGANFALGGAIPWQAIVGASVSTVALAAFGGFYLAARRARVAIAASFLMTFIVTLTYALTIREFASAAANDARMLVDDFRTVVLTVVGFYFGSEGLVSIAKVWKTTGSPADVQRADRDLVTR